MCCVLLCVVVGGDAAPAQEQHHTLGRTGMTNLARWCGGHGRLRAVIIVRNDIMQGAEGVDHHGDLDRLSPATADIRRNDRICREMAVDSGVHGSQQAG